MRLTRLVCLCSRLIFAGVMFSAVPAHAGVGVSPSSLAFGSIAVNSASSPATVVISNNGRQLVSIVQISSGLPEFAVIVPVFPITLSPHTSVSFQVKFQPDSALSFSGNIVVSTNRKSGGTQIISVSGTGTSPPPQTYLLSASISSLSFGNILLGTTASQSISLTNSGTGSVNVSQLAITGAGFSVSGLTGATTLVTGQSLPLTVSFAPSAAGSMIGSLTVLSSATNSPATISLSGNGVQPQISVIPGSVNFSNVAVGVSNTQTLNISNPGTANLSVTQALLGGTSFSISGLSLPLSVAPGGSVAFTAGFKPLTTGSSSGSLTLVNNTANSPLIVPLAGAGVSAVAQLTASPTSINFGSINLGATASQTVTLSNSGNSSVSLSQISVSGGAFSDSGFALPLTLAAGQATSLSATFTPTASGSFSGSVSIVSNATNSPLAVSLSGSGIAPVSHSVTLDWTPGSSPFAGFNVYRGSVSGGPYSKVNSALILSASFVDASVASGFNYYYVATEVDSTGAERAYSGEAIATIP